MRWQHSVASKLGAGLVLRFALIAIAPWDAWVPVALVWGLFADLGLALVITVVSDIVRRVPVAGAMGRFVGTFVWLFWLAVQFFYFEEFGTRFDQIAVNYLVYTAEISGEIWEGYPVVRILAGIGLVAGLATWRTRGQRLMQVNLLRLAFAGTGAVLFVAAIAIPCPVGRRVTREIADNGLVTLVRARLDGELDYYQYYPSIPGDEAVCRTRELLAADPGFVRFTDSSVRRVVGPASRSPAAERSRPLDVVLIIAESLGSELVDTLSRPGAGRTPHLDRAAERGVLFSRVYASGTRTARGLEAILASFPPIPGPPVFKRAGARRVDTLASVLAARGYTNVFVYGGDPEFDDMRSFALDHGFASVLGQDELDPGADAFETAWGYADEHLFDRVLAEMRRLRARGEPFLVTALTVSHHRPFRFPEGRLDRMKQGSRTSALRYADWSLGRFLEQASQEGLHDGTIFAIVADHGHRAYLREQLPLSAHRVPFVLIAPGTLPAGVRSSTVGSTMDVAPTILGVLGLPYEASFFGRDLLASRGPGRALVQNKRDVGMLSGDRFTIIGFRRSVAVARVGEQDRYTPVPAGIDHPSVRRAIGVLQTAYDLQRGALADMAPVSCPDSVAAPPSVSLPHRPFIGRLL